MADRITVKWMDTDGNEVDKDNATQALVTTYDDEDNVVDESFGTVEPASEVAEQE